MGKINRRQALPQRYMEEVGKSEPLSPEAEAALARRIRQGDMKARAELIEANLRFVVSVALKYQNRRMPLEDLISAGNIGLIRAAERFDEARGVKFISCAVWWIRQAILQTLIEHERTVRLPANRLALLQRIMRCDMSLEKKTSHRPDEEQIAEELGISADFVVDTLLRGQHTLSLDTTIEQDGQSTLMAETADENQEAPDTLLMRKALRRQIEAVLDTLHPHEREVITLYFGLGDTPEMTLEEIGCRFGVTRERIRQIKEKGLLKLRNPSRAKQLVPYTEDI